jgi:hypothetical protein
VAATVFAWSSAEQAFWVQEAIEETKLELLQRQETSVAVQPVAGMAAKAQLTCWICISDLKRARREVRGLTAQLGRRAAREAAS